MKARERESICWFTSEMVAKAKCGPGQGPKPGIVASSPTWVAQAPALGAILRCLPRCISKESDLKWSSRYFKLALQYEMLASYAAVYLLPQSSQLRNEYRPGKSMVCIQLA